MNVIKLILETTLSDKYIQIPEKNFLASLYSAWLFPNKKFKSCNIWNYKLILADTDT